MIGIITPSQPRRRQFVESSICVFLTRILTAVHQREIISNRGLILISANLCLALRLLAGMLGGRGRARSIARRLGAFDVVLSGKLA